MHGHPRRRRGSRGVFKQTKFAEISNTVSLLTDRSASAQCLPHEVLRRDAMVRGADHKRMRASVLIAATLHSVGAHHIGNAVSPRPATIPGECNDLEIEVRNTVGGVRLD